jgi:hypothetical protein
MISDEVGSRPSVSGSSIAIVAVGPMPGSTPIMVPSSAPKKQNSRFSGARETLRPWMRL